LRVNHRLKLFLFAAVAVGILGVFHVGASALNTIAQLDVIEAERDAWQRPAEVLQALNLKPGHTVVDLGCGSGYFTLRLARVVGKSGFAIGEDIRKEPLAFLWARTLMRRESSIRILYGDRSDPHLPAKVDAVLISNTFHELTDSDAILRHVYDSLVPGGRLVILDRSPPAAADQQLASHEVASDLVAAALSNAQFGILDRQEHFIASDPGGESWWMITAGKPQVH
jgi:ubiquinone/menaquinone biosynthesis C-methylase UbiE